MIRHRYNIFIKSNHNSNVEGVTEFIQVSSTGHMILIGWAIGFEGEFAKMFEVVIQLS